METLLASDYLAPSRLLKNYDLAAELDELDFWWYIFRFSSEGCFFITMVLLEPSSLHFV